MHKKRLSICMMFSMLMICTALMTGTSQNAPMMNALTQKEVSDGWILLFDGATDFGWKPRGEAKWKVHDGMVEANEGGAGMLATTTEFADYELKAQVWIDEKGNSGLFQRCPLEGEITPQNSYEVNIFDAHKEWHSGSINLVKRARGKTKTVGKWSEYYVKAEKDRLIVSIEGKRLVDTYDAKHKRGVIALQYNGAGTVRFRNIMLRPLGGESLFNGKDLTGWTPLPGRRSVFSVTKEGWLNIKDGNGDIQSEKPFGDFVLQLDIISNGDKLNSGVFFRSNKDKFWEGYEAQIRNQWQGDDRTKPVDFGTGGIYNRQPARRVVSSDREWFTMTVVAHGLHFATWVNGIQVTDYVDTQNPSESNARNGSRRQAGIFTLQGHDPTTDLSFKNIRAAEYPNVMAK